ncbi:hypothetical protein PR048_018862 [Dryococelus australis]|uniref:Uncharacterized protein n=1 Tax=Dryococelus australis TaxID=614101 RepID=A0ABQ9H1Y5_9NEOP|nr:hypothetical protein PR048_018862 [Dryococelus australis]
MVRLLASHRVLDYRWARGQIFSCGNHTERCHWGGGGVLSFPTPFHSGAAPYSPRFTLIGSQDLDIKRRPNLCTPLSIQTHVNGYASDMYDILNNLQSSLRGCPRFVASDEADIVTAFLREVAHIDGSQSSLRGCPRFVASDEADIVTAFLREVAHIDGSQSSLRGCPRFVASDEADIVTAFLREVAHIDGSQSSLRGCPRFVASDEADIVTAILREVAHIGGSHAADGISRCLPDFRKRESCLTVPLVGGFSRGSPVPLPFILTLLRTHLNHHFRFSRPRCYEPSKSLHLLTLLICADSAACSGRVSSELITDNVARATVIERLARNLSPWRSGLDFRRGHSRFPCGKRGGRCLFACRFPRGALVSPPIALRCYSVFISAASEPLNPMQFVTAAASLIYCMPSGSRSVTALTAKLTLFEIKTSNALTNGGRLAEGLIEDGLGRRGGGVRGHDGIMGTLGLRADCNEMQIAPLSRLVREMGRGGGGEVQRPDRDKPG